MVSVILCGNMYLVIGAIKNRVKHHGRLMYGWELHATALYCANSKNKMFNFCKMGGSWEMPDFYVFHIKAECRLTNVIFMGSACVGRPAF